jgi:hypothetical protein
VCPIGFIGRMQNMGDKRGVGKNTPKMSFFDFHQSQRMSLSLCSRFTLFLTLSTSLSLLHSLFFTLSSSLFLFFTLSLLHSFSSSLFLFFTLSLLHSFSSSLLTLHHYSSLFLIPFLTVLFITLSLSHSFSLSFSFLTISLSIFCRNVENFR